MNLFHYFLWESLRVPGWVEPRKNSSGKNVSLMHCLSLLESLIRDLAKRVSFTLGVKEASFTSAIKCRVTNHTALVRWLSSLLTLTYSKQVLFSPYSVSQSLFPVSSPLPLLVYGLSIAATLWKWSNLLVVLLHPPCPPSPKLLMN